jgi:hypothetical protein
MEIFLKPVYNLGTIMPYLQNKSAKEQSKKRNKGIPL